ncbi:MAG: hypothetical protein ABI885_23865, partial [Gammaproteobacteria bacterium]
DRIEGQIAEMRAEDKSLREKIDGNHVTLNAKIDGNFTTLNDKIDGNFATLNTKIDRNHALLSAKIDNVNATLSEKIDDLDRKMTNFGSKQTALLWVVGGLGTLITLAMTVGKALSWF